MNRKVTIPLFLKICYVILLAFTVAMGFFFGGGREGFKNGWNSAETASPISDSYHSYIRDINRKPILLNNDSDSIIIENSYSKVLVYRVEKKQQLLVYSIIKWIGMLLIVFSGIFIFTKLYRFFDAISSKEIFTLKNIKRLKEIGITSIFLSFIFIVYDYTDYLAVKSTLHNYPYSVSLFLDFFCWPAILGIVLIAIAYAFKKGVQLQQENELTI